MIPLDVKKVIFRQLRHDVGRYADRRTKRDAFLEIYYSFWESAWVVFTFWEKRRIITTVRRCRSYRQQSAHAESVAIGGGVRRVHDLATGRVKGLTESEFAMTSRKTASWLRKPNPSFGGATPIEVICIQGSTGAKRVAYEFEQLELGAAKAVRKALKEPPEVLTAPTKKLLAKRFIRRLKGRLIRSA